MTKQKTYQVIVGMTNEQTAAIDKAISLTVAAVVLRATQHAPALMIHADEDSRQIGRTLYALYRLLTSGR